LDPQTTQRVRNATAALAIAWALLALALSLVARVEATRSPVPPVAALGIGGDYWIVQWASEEARAAGVEVGDRLLAVDGEPADTYLLEQLRQLTPDVPNRYLLEKRDGRRLAVSIAPQPPGSDRPWPALAAAVGIPVVGLVYLGIGLAVWRLRPERAASWAFLLFCCAMAALLFGSGWSLGPALDLQWLHLPLVGATAFHLFTTYPLEPDWVVRRPGIRFALYPLALALGGVTYAAGLTSLSPEGWREAAFVFPIAVGFFCTGMLVVERRRAPEGDERDRADAMLLGALVSFVPVLVVAAAHFFLRLTVPWFLSFLWFVLFPVGVGYGIVRKQLFDIRSMARSSVAYTMATLTITGLYAFLIVSADAAFRLVDVNARSPWFSVAFLFVAILLFNPLRDRLQAFVDRWFDRDRRSYRRAVREISEAMVSMLSIKEIVDRILIAATDTMGLERAMVLILDDETRELRVAASRGDWEPEALAVHWPADHPVAKQLWMRRQILARSDFDEEPDPEVREACRDVFDTLEVELLVPILFGVDLLGVVAVGRKFSGERLDAPDQSLLRTLANQSAIAIENAKAYDEIAQLNETLEARVEQRTRELRRTQEQLMQAEKLKSLGQLVAGVAHELNNPIGFVHANIQLIEEKVQRIADPETPPEARERAREALAKLLRRSREGTERVKQIVQDLRTFSRMDQADLQEVDLHEEIDRTLTLMEPRCKNCIRIERDYGKLPRVRCFPGQLNQVFLNLLVNACDAIDGQGTIRVVTRPTSDGVCLEFHDTGQGIPPEAQSRIFDPFFTTKPVGKGTGLGLSLSHGIVERHGGRMHVESEPGQGTVFTIELPLDANPQDD